MGPLIDNDDIQIQSQERLGWAAVAWSVVLLKGQKPGPAHGHGQGWKIVQGGILNWPLIATLSSGAWTQKHDRHSHIALFVRGLP